MKKICIILGAVLLISCTKECPCTKYYEPMIIKPTVFYTSNPTAYHGKTGNYFDAMGNKITYKIICFEE